MKGFVASLLLFAALLAAIAVNCVFVARTTEQAQALLAAIKEEENAPALASKLEAFWQKREPLLMLSVSYDKLCEMRTQLASLRVAAEFGQAAELERARLLALNLLEQIRRPERFSLCVLL